MTPSFGTAGNHAVGPDHPGDYRSGFVLGKFLPPHAGHIHLIETGVGRCARFTVLVCTLEREPIPGIVRYRWLCELFPTLNVVHVAEEVPSYPHEDPEGFEAIWTDLLRRHLPADVDAFFSSEDYGEDVAAWLGIDHVMVDRARSAVRVSGTEIRARPLHHWDFIPEVVRPHYVAKVALMGPESTGKSTLAPRLARHFDTVDVQEHGRDIFPWEDPDFHFTLEGIEAILEGHTRDIEDALSTANRILVCDTEAITTKVWSEIYFGSCPASVEMQAQVQRFALYLLLDVDVPWVDDGTRSHGHMRHQHFGRIEDELRSRGLPYVVVSGSWEERFETAVEAVERLVMREG